MRKEKGKRKEWATAPYKDIRHPHGVTPHSIARTGSLHIPSSRIAVSVKGPGPAGMCRDSTSGKKICVRTHQALGTLWTHPVNAHTAPNAKRTGNVNSDAARHGTVRPDAARHGICLPDGVWQGIFFLDAPCQGIFLLDAAVSGHFPSGRSRVRAFSFWTQPCQGKWHPDDTCHGTTVTLAVKAQNITANTCVAFANTQRVPGIVTQSSSILYI